MEKDIQRGNLSLMGQTVFISLTAKNDLNQLLQESRKKRQEDEEDLIDLETDALEEDMNLE